MSAQSVLLKILHEARDEGWLEFRDDLSGRPNLGVEATWVVLTPDEAEFVRALLSDA